MHIHDIYQAAISVWDYLLRADVELWAVVCDREKHFWSWYIIYTFSIGVRYDKFIAKIIKNAAG